MKTLQQILTISVAVTLAIFMVAGINQIGKGIIDAQDRKATYECLAWYNEMLDNDKMFMTNWQQMQCSYYGIDLNLTPNGE